MSDPLSPSLVSSLPVSPSPLSRLPLGALQPAGWLREQMLLQRDGMAGHLDEFWPDVRDSAWIGGSADGWERGPYWLDALIPLAFGLQDDRLINKAHHWVEAILERQSEDGWMGPDIDNPDEGADNGLDVWPRMIVLKALLQYRSATDDPRIVPAALRLARRIGEVLADQPLSEWARVRWADLVHSLHELFAITGETWLHDLAELVIGQGFDWRAYGHDLPFKEKVDAAQLDAFKESAGLWMNDGHLSSHGVNIAMGLKALPVQWAGCGDDDLRTAFDGMLDQLDTFHGQANGLYSCDEHLAGTHPSQGTEACTVVEYLYSLEVATEVWGVDEAIADRLERLAFNALPATAKADEWGHQYVQQANQVICHVTEDRVYSNNGPDANVFGLEPHFGCCTANRHQGWPKLLSHLWLATADGGLAALSYAPCMINTERDGRPVRVEVSGDYPFTDEVIITVTVQEGGELPLHLRIPGWAEQPTLMINDKPVDVESATTKLIKIDQPGQTTLRLTLPASVRSDRSVKEEERSLSLSKGITLTRGPIIFALAVDEDWRRTGGEDPHATWEVHPASPWNYALVVDHAGVPDVEMERDLRQAQAAEARAQVAEAGAQVAEAGVFSPEGARLRLRAVGRQVPGWEIEHGAAARPPASPVEVSTPERPVVLLPYGAIRLRVTALPWTSRD